ncbi:methenyltetrahydrofolate synthase domain-containing protein-like isoform X1 [Limulus polyphemus]|uniref:Methenyltetrahydrofolate synthase domain-containing protein-like isoform X1 n=1 Tax=Limulus polyphemus TaxID=6850 RepID=A0ABM1BMW7_LIMPO|nr:methenyltetrahydrofolate synthase domain-containing protein-like isoform X1 [Limulus polyphemus]
MLARQAVVSRTRLNRTLENRTSDTQMLQVQRSCQTTTTIAVPTSQSFKCQSHNMTELDSTVTKASIRQKIWKYLEENDIACFPRPVYHRIPNFKGANQAGLKVHTLEEFRKARVIKVNPDKPQEEVRFLALEAHKTLLVPTPRLRSGLFNKINPPAGCNKKVLHLCATSQGVKQHSTPVSLDTKLKVDLIVIGSVAVSRAGHRIGKGEGYADLEYAMMSTIGAVDQDVIVVTTVHDCQVFDELPQQLFGDHDVTVDVIVTPTQIIRCEPRLSKPTKVNWALLSKEKLSEIPVLKTLRGKEQKDGKDVALKHAEKD